MKIAAYGLRAGFLFPKQKKKRHHSVSLFFWRKLQGSLFLREKLRRLK